jgi:D-3-phosphoglycerate dehydrogenase
MRPARPGEETQGLPCPRVLISDALSPAAVQIFRDRGVAVEFQPDLGKDKDRLAEAIGHYDGLAIRSATKVTAKLLERANGLKVIGRAGIGVDNVDIPAATARGVIVMNTPFGNSITTAEHAVAMMFALARRSPRPTPRPRPGAGRRTASWGRADGENARDHRLRQYRFDRGRQGARAAHEVVAFDPFLSPERAIDLGVEKVELDELWPAPT